MTAVKPSRKSSPLGGIPFEEILFLAVVVEGPRQRAAESAHMRPAIFGVNVVDVGMDAFRIFGGVLQSDFVFDLVACPRRTEHDVGVERIAGAIEVFDEFGDATVVFVVTALAVSFVQKLDPNAGIEKREFLETLVEHVERKFRRGEHLGVGFERGFRSRLLCRSTLFDAVGRDATLILLVPGVAFTADFDLGPLREKVHDGDTDTVQGHPTGRTRLL